MPLRRQIAETSATWMVLITPTVPISPPTIADLQSGLQSYGSASCSCCATRARFNVRGTAGH